MTRRLRRYYGIGGRRDESGTVTVEFALLMPIAVLFIGFILALGLRTLWAGLAEDAARSLARYSSIQTSTGSYPNRAAVLARSGSLLGGILGTPTLNLTEMASTAVTYDQDATATPGLGEGDVVTVNVTYQIPGVSSIAELVKNLPGIGVDLTGFTSVTGTSSARRE